jgi:hypothetical protein
MRVAVRTAIASLLAATIAAGEAFAQSCAMCASSFGENDPMARAISWSILFMMAAPYAVVGTIAAVLIHLHRRPPDPIIERGRTLRPAGEGDIP